jgi:ABC-2 type transport system ATP-binding protein
VKPREQRGTTQAVIETHGLTRTFGERRAVDGLNLLLEPGEVLGLLGPNGAGKTTTIRILTTLLAPTAGTALVCGLDVQRQPAEVRELLGYVSQEKGVRHRLTGREAVQIEADLFHVPRPRRDELVDEVLDAVGLLPDADKLVSAYSGGMTKRIDLACALLRRPEVLILDEPTLALDVQSRRRVWDYISWLRDEGIAVLLATNYLDEADRLCDRVMIVDAGREVVTGTPAALKRMVPELVAAVPPGDGEAERGGDEHATLEDVFLLHTGKPLREDSGEAAGIADRLDLASAGEGGGSLAAWLQEVRAFLRRWYLEVRRERLNLFLTLLQPAIWLIFFGGALGRAIDGGTVGTGDYVGFIMPGVLAFIAVGVGISGAIPLLWDKETGYLQRLMSMPIARSSLLASRLAFQMAIALGEGLVALAVALVMGVEIATGVPGAALMLLVGALLAVALTALFLALAYSTPGHNTFFAVSGFVTLPLVFVSNAFVPLDAMPDWMAAAAAANPLTYGIDAIRRLVIGPASAALVVDVAVVVAFAAACTALAAIQFRRRGARVAE